MRKPTLQRWRSPPTVNTWHGPVFSSNRLRRAIAFHDLETGKTEPLTFGDRDEHAPCFVDGGWQLAFVASHAFAPVYAGGTSDSTWIYPDREVLMLTTHLRPRPADRTRD